jgi:hypothetical protein
MAPTAVEVLSRDNPLLRNEIKRISEKWEKRTVKSGTIWPAGGTFDQTMCRDMEVVIRNYKPNRSGKKPLEKRDREKLVLALFEEEGERLEKRDREKLVLALFEEEGERWRALQRVARKIITKKEEAQPLPLKLEPPPYKPTKMYPLLTGNVEIKGEVTLDEGDNKCNTQGRRGAPIHMDCYEGIRKAREECSNADTSYSKSEDEDEDETSGDEHSNKDVKDGNERICEGPSPRKKRRGKNTKTRTKSQKRQTKKSTKLKGEGYSESPATEEPGCSILYQY